MALAAIMGIAQAGLGVAGSMAGHANQMRIARAQNEALMQQYEQQLKIRDKRYKDEQQIYATKLGMYDLRMKATDRAAARAFGVEQYNQSQRLKQAAFQGMNLDRALAAQGGRAAASGRSGRSAQRLDTNVENTFIRNQNMIAQNLLTAEEGRDIREMGMRDKFQSYRNEAFADVAVAPTIPLEIPEPIQHAGPSSAGAMIGAASSVLGAVGGFMNNMPPDIGNMGAPAMPAPAPTL